MNEMYVRKTLGKHILTDSIEPIMDLDKSKGFWIVDKRNQICIFGNPQCFEKNVTIRIFDIIQLHGLS